MNKNTKTLFLLVLHLAKVSGASCPAGWTPKEDRGLCFKYYTSITDHKSATDDCFHEEAILATPKNSSEVEFLANNVIGSLNEYVWVGLVKRSSIEPWTFADGFPFKPTMPSWDLWDNGFPASPTADICAYMTAAAGSYKFKTANCNSQYQYICQKTMVQHSCPMGWAHAPGGSVCYKAFGDSYTYNQSVDICNSNGSYILMPKDPHEDMFFSWYLNKYEMYKKIWIGYKLENSNFVWESGYQANYTGWENDEPHSWEDCAVYAANGVGFDRWYGLDCSLPAVTYCQDTDLFNTLDSTTEQVTTVITSQMTTEATSDTSQSTQVTTQTTPGATQTTPGTTQTAPGTTQIQVTTQTTPGTTQTTPGTTQIQVTTQTTPGTIQIQVTTQTTPGANQATPGTTQITSDISDSTAVTTQTTSNNIVTTHVLTQTAALSSDALTHSGDGTTFTEAQTTKQTAATTMLYSSTTISDVSCGCLCYGNRTNITTEELQELLLQIKSNLTVDTKTLSSAIRQLTSAYDSRVSSKSIGSVGVAVLVSVMVFLLFLDLVPVNFGCALMKTGK
ncbi:uncharacterized protein LOC134238247 [Saccostrea cucullata]|uniref:uncharacterized protein LOC134238247 n=1 Tax=Saccostrea cuccullata TaxID=36930 RepID=UPI002ED0E12A